MFSPGNLRATFDNPNYERLISHYIGEKYTLRYTGGMVPDVFQIIVKEKGVFTNVISPSTKAKLRILFEVAPLSLLVRSPAKISSTSCPAWGSCPTALLSTTIDDELSSISAPRQRSGSSSRFSHWHSF